MNAHRMDNDAFGIGSIFKMMEVKLVSYGLTVEHRSVNRAIEDHLAEILVQTLLSELDNSVVVQEDSLEAENYFETNEKDLRRYLNALGYESREDNRRQSIHEEESDEDTKNVARELVSVDREKQFIEYVQEHPTHKIKTLLARFRWLKSFHQKSVEKMRRRALEDRRSRRLKLVELESCLWHKFQDARSKYHTVSDFDLSTWALGIAKQMNLTNFVASQSFITAFKKEYNVSSRAITKVVTRRNILSLEQKEAKAREFAEELNKFIKDRKLKHEFVFNADQTGIPYEIMSRRTLSHTGEKSTFACAMSTNATKHSFTAMFLVSADGSLLPKTLLCLQEVNGRFGERVLETLYQPHNISLTCTRSGLFTESIFQYWVDNILNSFIPENEESLLLIDSWAPHKNKDNYISISERQCSIKIIPAQTTAFAQPLDVYFNRQVKQLIRYVTNQVKATVVTGGALDRNSVISIMSLAQFTLSAPCFRPMVAYSFKKSGYIDESYPFLTVLDVCRVKKPIECWKDACLSSSCFCCPWCKESYCIRCIIGMTDRPHMLDCANYAFDR